MDILYSTIFKMVQQNIIDEMLKRYDILYQEKVDPKEIFQKLALEYKLTQTDIKKYFKRSFAKMIHNNEVSMNEISKKYAFTTKSLQTSLDFYYPKTDSTITEVQNTQTQDLQDSKEEIVNTIVDISEVSDTSNILNILNILNKINNEIQEMKSIIAKQNKQIETSFEVIQNLIHAKNPVELVALNKEKRIQDGTLYVEPPRPVKDAQKIEISKYNDNEWKLSKCYFKGEKFKSLGITARFMFKEKFWVIHNDHISKFEDTLKTENLAYIFLTETVDTALVIVPDENIEEIEDTLTIVDEITSSIFV